jgi:U1 small nuclear ribonucleoprotein
MIKNLLVCAAAALTLTVVSPAEVSARGFGGYHGGGSAGHYSGNREGGYSGNHYNGSHEGSFNGAGGASFGSGSGYHPHGAPYGAAGGYRNGAEGAWGAGAYGAAAYDTSGYYSAIPSDEGVTTQPYMPPTTGPIVNGGMSIVPGAVGAWGGDGAAFRGAGGGAGGGFRGGVR